MTISPETEETVRMAERNVNKVWNKWRQDFDSKSSKEVLAMVAYQFAKRYYQLLAQINHQESLLGNFETELDRLLQIMGPESTVDTPAAPTDAHTAQG